MGAKRKGCAEGYRYGFNGKENDNEVKGNGNSVDFGARIYDPRLGRFLSLDPRIRDFPDLSPFAFAANIPIRYVDVDGEGPGDRVKAALSFFGKGIIYSQDAKLNSGELRTGSSAQALKYLDCSEFVCRVLKADGITAKVEAKTSGELSKYLSNTDKFTHSDKAQVGDIAVWGEWTVDKDKDGNAIIDPRTNKPKESWSGGHVGIVSEVDAKGNVKLVHAAGNGKGVKSNPYAIPAKDYRPDKTFAGFYRPNVETADGKQIDEVPKVEATPVETKTP